ncbi:MAG TPA: hypothetical protein VGB63_01550 [Pedobacter sp.]|jgi:hypothetical protein
MRSLIVIASALFMLGACKDNDDKQPNPTASELMVPAQNETCNTGIIISNTESKVLLKWSTSANTTNYELHIKDMLTTTSEMYQVTGTEHEVSLTRSTPYSWYVISKSDKSIATAKSAIWKFYNGGPGQISHPPFPADLTGPTIGQIFPSGTSTVTLDWDGSDVDNDIAVYDIYFGTTNNPAIKTSNLTTSILNNVEVSPNSVYYWKVITKDSKGNSSDSGVSEFRIN